VTVVSVLMTGGTSGTITLTTSSFTSTGNWDTSGAGSVFTKGTSTVTMSGVANIAILNASNNFNNLVISAAGAVTQTGLVDVSGTLTVSAGSILASSTFTLTVATSQRTWRVESPGAQRARRRSPAMSASPPRDTSAS